MKNPLLHFAAILFALTLYTHALGDDVPILNLTDYKDKASIQAHQDQLATITLKGKVSLAIQGGDFHAVVPDVHVWLAEYPASKPLNVTSDEKGWWTMKILKPKGTKVNASIFYTKPGWITTKSNVITFTDRDDTDLSIQYIDPFFFRLFVRPMIELMMQDLVENKSEAAIKNAIVVTVGKSWASMHDDRLPHGDPNATVNAIPGAIRPIYFDKHVKPNPALTCTSVDGGVLWLNAPTGTHVLKTSKEGVKYTDVTFVIDEHDKEANPESEVVLYIASPPDAVQGTNDSAPGKN